MTDYNLPERLRQYLASVDEALAGSGVDALVRAGIIRDIEAQIADMRSEEGRTEDDILSRLDPPEAYIDPSSFVSVTGKSPKQRIVDGAENHSRPTRVLEICLYVITVIGAAAAIITEAVFKLCKSGLGNPIPTEAHLAALLATPIIIIYTAISLRKNRARVHDRTLAFMNGFLLVVAISYSAAFAPLDAMLLYHGMSRPVYIFATPLILLCLLPLSPWLALFSGCAQGLRLREYFRNNDHRPKIGRWWIGGLTLGLLIIGGWEGYAALREQAVDKAMMGEGAARQAGIDMLRRLHAEPVILRNSYARDFAPDGTIFFFYMKGRNRMYNSAAYQTLYYRMTGRDYRDASRSPSAERIEETMDNNSQIGGDIVGSSVRRLSLRSAALDISASSSQDGRDSGPSAAYAELMLEFLNEGGGAQEARCQIILPPGGVASRLTLWIDGVEQESAFGGRSTVKEAYRDVAVTQRRDPALVTTSGPDRVLLQCFPVRPNIPMKVKVGFTLPLIPDGDKSSLVLPYIAERNFAYAPGLEVAVWAESNAAITTETAGLIKEAITATKRTGEGLVDASRTLYAVRGKVAPNALADCALYQPANPGTVAYRAELSGVVGYSSLVRAEPYKERLVAVVLDTSVSMAAKLKGSGEGFQLANALRAAPDGVKIALFAGSTAIPPMTAAESMDKWPAILKNIRFEGADEQTGNLERAWDLCAAQPNSAVLWIHDKLPADIADMTGIQQRIRRRAGEASPAIFSLQLASGANRIEEKIPAIKRLPAYYGLPLEERLSRVLSMSLYPNMTNREQIFSTDAPAMFTAQGSPHITRLAYAGYISQKTNSGGSVTEDERERAREIRIVTEATGAVVLESAAQYKSHDLNPASNSKNIPTIPEPEEYAIMAVVCALLVIIWRRRLDCRAR
ncbi:MAG: hypothetical protein LBT23_07565 [Synergistaceae bacterium]|jgi:hypothetical protein|nr:hypothetical protein [Synergistaceae bacterium]